MKPILFNTEMVRAILDGHKSVARRAIKPQPKLIAAQDGYGPLLQIRKPHSGVWFQGDPNRIAPYQPGDILYVQETWAHPSQSEIEYGADPNMYLYKADYPLLPAAWDKWRPSVIMPKEAARLFLRVTGVRVERLQEITGQDVVAEGVDNGSSNPAMGKRWENMQRTAFSDLWDSTIKKSYLPRYGWAANPWVWVIEFERISKEEVQKGGDGNG